MRVLRRGDIEQHEPPAPVPLARPAGLRIASPAGSDPGALQVTAAPGPSANDQVVEAAGAHVYLEPQAAAYLEDKVLDAEVDSEGKAHFSLGLQGPAQA